MQKIKVYLSGKMKDTDKMECYAWRENLTDSLSVLDFVKVLDPAKYFNYEYSVAKPKEIMQWELNKVRESDLVVVRADGINESIGTAIEIYEAYKNDIPVILYNPNQLVSQYIHDWLRECIVHECLSDKELIDYLAFYYT